ncbi:hypothetical protein RB653_008679 [Dictyostelium firmibasis]|uniref:Uncharacterized protein n=1 Tax=Dictyostelium firmibasis TaxID=79012 RepID=A0AAN7UD06_9MYCE
MQTNNCEYSAEQICINYFSENTNIENDQGGSFDVALKDSNEKQIREEKIREIEKKHSWEEVVILYKSLAINCMELNNQPEARNKIAKHIVNYKTTLLQLINYYLDQKELDIEKWNRAIENNKILLHKKIKKERKGINPKEEGIKSWVEELQILK